MAKNMEIYTANLKSLNTKDQDQICDGSQININQKELGVCEIYPIVL